MNYTQTLQYLYEQLPMFHRIGAAAYKGNLNNTHAIDKLLGRPHREFVAIHVAGTNGKGSVSHMLASVLQHAGYKTGLYTSPHLKDFRERIRVNGKMIPRSYVTEFVKRHKRDFEKIKPSFFEWTVGLAFDYFRHRKPHVVIVETGLGGRLDSTNIITPVLSVITNVGLDHTNLLGKTLPLIAREKAGIIKKNVPVIIGESQQAVKKIFIKKARSLNAPLVYANRRYSIKERRQAARPAKWVLDVFRKDELFLKKLHPDLTGRYQLKNLCTVMAAVEGLRNHFSIPVAALRNGLASVGITTGLQGRWQVLHKNPLVICDAGHNEDGLREAAMNLKLIKYKSLHIVWGIVSDKDPAAMLRHLPRRARYYFCKAAIPRGLDSSILARQAARMGLAGEVYPSVKQAYRAALSNASRHDVVFIGGSIFTIAEVL